MIIFMKIISKSLTETEKFAAEFVAKLEPKKDEATFVALSGELGSGKTTFVQCIARTLGVQENITSPTFVLIKSYQLPVLNSPFEKGGVPISIGTGDFKILFHIDAYRLESGKELTKLGFEEIVANPNNIIFLEWPENVAEVLPEGVLRINFEFVNEETRKIIL